jgi:hypothetical protein
MFINELSLIYIASSRPLKGRRINNNEIFGELMTCFIIILQVLFTDFCDDPEIKFASGWVYCLMIAFSCLYFYSFVLKSILIDFILLRGKLYHKIVKRKINKIFNPEPKEQIDAKDENVIIKNLNIIKIDNINKDVSEKKE